MCKNVTATVGALLEAEEPTVEKFLSVVGQTSTPDGIAAMAAYNALDKDLLAWTPGTTGQVVIEGVETFDDVFDTIPVPADAKVFADLITAGLVTVVGLITANSPAPATPVGPATAEETKLYQAHVAADTAAKVQALVPGLKLSLWDKGRAALGDHTVVAKEYQSHWAKAVAAADPKYAAMKCTW